MLDSHGPEIGVEARVGGRVEAAGDRGHSGGCAEAPREGNDEPGSGEMEGDTEVDEPRVRGAEEPGAEKDIELPEPPRQRGLICGEEVGKGLPGPAPVPLVHDEGDEEDRVVAVVGVADRRKDHGEVESDEAEDSDHG